MSCVFARILAHGRYDHVGQADDVLGEMPVTDLRGLLASFGDAPVARPPPGDRFDAWFAAANARPAWQLWGKARPSSDSPAHPLLCHMVDVAAVAGVLLTSVLPAATRGRLLGATGLPAPDSLRFLLFLVALHDFGKATPEFQSKVDWARARMPALGFDLNAPKDARHHGDIGFVLLEPELVRLGVLPSVGRPFARAVAAHHGEFPTNVTRAKTPGAKESGAKPAWGAAREGLVSELCVLFRPTVLPETVPAHSEVLLLAGLTAVADWLGSMDDVFAYETPQATLSAYWPVALERAAVALERAGMRPHALSPAKSFVELFPKYDPWPLHVEVDRLAVDLDEPCLIVVEAPMGEGKTEASLLLAEAAAARLGQQGLYIGLPTQATANQMLGRVQDFLSRVHEGEGANLVLAHGEASLNERFRTLSAVYDAGRSSGGVRAEGWFLSKKRTLLADHAVGTIDQALLGVMNTRHGFVRLFGLAGKTVILDEVHAYDTYTSTILDRLVEWLAALGSTVLLLSATLPEARRRALVHAYRRGAGATDEQEAPRVSYPRITRVSRRLTAATTFASRAASTTVSLERRKNDLDALADELVAVVGAGGCIGWICNTVGRAQAAYEAVRSRAPHLRQLLLHSRLLPDDRARAERQLESWLGPAGDNVSRPHACIVVGTQVLEQSLDVDFDLLVTDLAPIDLLLQRAGRLQRHARSNRATGYEKRRLLVVAPEGGFADVETDDVAIVYEEALVRETLRVLEGRQAITLPDEIESLVEAVYCGALPVDGDALFDLKIAHLGTRIAERQNAEVRLIPAPTVEDDPFGALKVRYDDDEDPSVHAQLRAMTRLGDVSVDIVCLVRRAGVLYPDDASNTPLDLQARPDRALTERFVRRSIGVSRAALVRTLLDEPSYAPAGWRECALLRYRRAVGFEDGVAFVGNLRLVLDRELGLRIDRVDTSKKAKGTA